MEGELKRLIINLSEQCTFSCRTLSGSLGFTPSVLLTDGMGLGIVFGHLEVVLALTGYQTCSADRTVSRLG